MASSSASTQQQATGDSAWYSKLTGGSGTRGKASCEKDAEAAEMECPGFGFAEAMELGIARGLPSSYVQPPSGDKGTQAQRLVVYRSQEKGCWSLVDTAGASLILATASKDGLRFDLFVSHTGTEPTLGTSKKLCAGQQEAREPTFVLTAKSSERKEWLLTSSRCESCELRGRRRCGQGHLVRMRHYVESVGAGAYCMDVDFPSLLPDGRRSVVCATCCGGEEEARGVSWTADLTSRRPKWSEKHKSLTLNFKGKVKLASAKNFMLDPLHSRGSDVEESLLFGKVGEEKFVLEHRAPMGMVQAFAAVLSAFYWQ